ncbi:MAG: ABC transporter ATP-binding protein [Pseudomonadota bacterium]
MSQCSVRISGLSKRYGDLIAVDRLDLEVGAGEILGFLGPNGAGKTTTLQMMCGLLKPDAGSVELEGRVLTAGQGVPSIGVSPQNLVIWNTLTCQEQLEFVGRMYDLSYRDARQRARRLLGDFGLQDKARRLGRTLSGGMQRRLNIALALVHGPHILFLDEPQAGLDPQSRVLVREYLQSLRGRMTVIVTTHDMEEAAKLSDRVCVLDHGRLLALDTVTGILQGHGEGALTSIVIGCDAADARLANLESQITASGWRRHGNELRQLGPTRASAVAEVLQIIAREDLEVTGIHTRETTLEDVFLALTGRSLRE